MRTLSIFHFLLLLSLPFNLSAQPFEKYTGGLQGDFTQKIIALSDGNILMAGTRRIGLLYQINLRKLTPGGEVVWDQIYDSPDWEMANFADRTSDGGFIVTGAWFPFPQDTAHSDASVLLMKTDSLGNLEWKTKLPDWYHGFCTLETAAGEYLVGTMKGLGGTLNNAGLLKFSSSGALLWSKTYSFHNQNRTKRIFPAPGGGYFLAGRTNGIGNTFNGLFFAKISDAGNMTWVRELDIRHYVESDYSIVRWTQPLGAVQLPDGSVIIANPQGPGGYYDFQVVLVKYDPSGKLLWKRNYTGIPGESNYPYDLHLCPDGRSLIVAGKSGDNEAFNQGFAMKIDTAGYEHWRRTFGGTYSDRFFSSVCLPDSSLLFAGVSNSGGNGGFDQWLVKTDAEGNLLPYSISGKIWIDRNGNCEIDSTIDAAAKNWFVRVNDQQVLLTGQDGIFTMQAPPGVYQLSALAPDSLWSFCANDLTASTDSLQPAVFLNFIATPAQSCPLVEVGITTPDLVRCDTSEVFVTWCNNGTADVAGQALEIRLGAGLTLIDASEPYSLDGQLAVFEIGDIAHLACGSLKLKTALDCGAPLGAAHCIEARMYESENCLPAWDGPFLKITGICDAGFVRFALVNTGTQDMTVSQPYRLLEDGIFTLQESFALSAGDSMVIKIPATGSTIRLETAQADGYPGWSLPSATVEGCGQSENGFISTGLFSLFHHDDTSPAVSMACVENTTNGLPNKIVEQPEGYGYYHLIGPNTENEYVIRFLNPYPDTVNDIRIRLKLSEFLDLPSFHPTAWSHPFSMRFLPNDDLEIQLSNVTLPPVSADKNGARVFIRFRAKQLPDVPNDSYLVNKAEVYFNFQGPLPLANAWHNVFYDFIATSPAAITAAPESYQYGGKTGIDFGNDLAEASDGSVFLAGTTSSYGGGQNNDGFLIKTDSYGKGIWYNAYDVEYGREGFFTVAPVPDGGCMAAGTYEPAGTFAQSLTDYHVLIVRVDKDGKMLWHKTIRPGIAKSMVATPDGHYVIGGYCKLASGYGQFLVKIDENGQVIWTRTYNYPFGETIYTEQVILIPGDGFLITGEINQLAWEPDIFIVKVQPDGNQAWFKYYDKEKVYDVKSAAVASDGNYVLLGTTIVENAPQGPVLAPFLWKIDPQGNEIWEKPVFAGQSRRTRGQRIISSPDNGFYLLTRDYKDTTFQDYDILLVKCDANGDTIWTKNFDTGIDEDGKNLILTSNGKVMMIGYHQPVNWLYDLQTLLFTANHTFDPSTDAGEMSSHKNHWQVSPNPNTGRINLKNQFQLSHSVKWALYNSTGIKIKQGEFLANEYFLDFGTLSPGIFFLALNDENGFEIKRLVVLY